MHSSEIYKNSALLAKLLRHRQTHAPKLRLAFLDIDSTMTGNREQTNLVRKILEDKQYVVIYVTSRTEEMLMSSFAYQKSVERGFTRPQPKLGKNDGIWHVVPPEITEASGILDPDIIAGSTGTQLAVKQMDGSFLLDTVYEERFGQDSDSWRENALGVIAYLNAKRPLAHLALYESTFQYENGLTNIFPPKYRIVIHLHAAEKYFAFLELFTFLRLYEEKHPIPFSVKNIKLTDDSDIEKGKYVFCLTPRLGHKAAAVEYIVDTISTKMQIAKEHMDVFLAGDGFPDLEMGLRAARYTNATFLLVGGSPLTDPLMSTKKYPYRQITDARDHMHPQTDGMYIYTSAHGEKRKVVMGEKNYPHTEGVGTVLAFLQDHLNTTDAQR